MSPGWAETRRVIRDVFPVVVVAYVVFLLVRTHVCERYQVPSASMEPTLHGDIDDGDVVLVDKTAWWGWRNGEPRPWDLVVVRNRLEPGSDHMVKRFIARGPGRVWLEDGDVYVQGPNDTEPKLLKKQPTEHEDLRVTAHEFPRTRGERPATLEFLRSDQRVWSREGDTIVLRAGDAVSMGEVLSSRSRDARREQRTRESRYLPGHLSTANEIDTSFLDSTGRRHARLRGVPRDVGLELTIELGAGVDALQLVVEEFEIYYSFRCATDGRGVFQVSGEDEHAFSLPRLQVGQPYEITFGYLDGEFFLVLDGRVVQVPFTLGEPVPIQVPTTAPARLRNLLHVGVIGAADGTATVTRLAVFHDIYYPPEAEPFRLQEDQVFLLGDNAVDSTDSRDFRFRDAPPNRLGATGSPAVGQFEIADLIGRPIAIIYPASRRRCLSR